jgi:hypothetical protein
LYAIPSLYGVGTGDRDLEYLEQMLSNRSPVILSAIKDMVATIPFGPVVYQV